MDDNKVTRRAEHAERLLKDQVLQEAIQGMRDTCYHNIETSNHSQADEREDLYYMLRCIRAFEEKLKTFVRAGKVEVNNMNIKQLMR